MVNGFGVHPSTEMAAAEGGYVAEISACYMLHIREASSTGFVMRRCTGRLGSDRSEVI